MKAMKRTFRFAASVLLILFSFSDQGWAKSAAGDHVQFGHNIVVDTDQDIGDAVCIGCSIRMHGTSHGDLVAIGGQIEIDGSVSGDVVALGGSVRLGPGADVRGDAVAVGGQVIRDPAAHIGGQTSSQNFPMMIVPGLAGLFLIGLLGMVPLGIVFALVCYLIAGERRVKTTAGAAHTQAGKALLTGIGALCFAALLIVMFAMVRHTGLFVVLIALGLFVTMVMGYTGLSLWVGRRLSTTLGPVAAVLLGAVLITILQAVPFIGPFFFIVFVMLALGSALLTGFGTSSDWLQRRAGIPPRPVAVS